jgi:ribosome-associated translation inhibitor RaiA
MATSLRELLLLRQLQDQSDPVRSAFTQLAEGVNRGIQTAREEQKKQKEIDKGRDAFFGDKTPNTNAYKTQRSFDTQTGKFSEKIIEKTGEDIAREQKIRTEAEIKSRELEAIEAVDDFVEGKITKEEFLNKDVTEEQIDIAHRRIRLKQTEQNPVPQEVQDFVASDKQNTVNNIQNKFVPDDINVDTGEVKSYKNLAIDEMKAAIEVDNKLQEGQRAALRNLSLISGSFKTVADTWVAAYEEGGVGSMARDLKSKIAIRLGGDIGDQFRQTSTLEGLLTEVVGRMMPMMTQQGDKPGSVRLVATIFEKLRVTAPEGFSGKGSARDRLEKTIINMYKFGRAAHQVGLNNEVVENLDQSTLDKFSDRVANIANSLEITGREKEVLDSLTNKILESFNRIEKPKQSEEPVTLDLNSVFSGIGGQ